MPKVKKFKPIEQEIIEDDLRSRYGGMMDAKSVGTELGLTHHSSYENWLSDVPFVRVNRLRRYRVADVAEKIYRSINAEKGA